MATKIQSVWRGVSLRLWKKRGLMNVKMGFEDDLEDHLDFFTNQE